MKAGNEGRRWRLTHVQSFIVVVLVSVAFFLAAMAFGGTSLPLFLVSVGLLALGAMIVVLLGLRHKAATREIATAYVVAVSPAPTGAIVGKCDMKLRVSLNGRPPVEVKHRDVALSVERWPRVGQELPVDVEPNSRQLRVRWDLIDLGYARAPDPTPPRPYQSAGSDTGHRDTVAPVRVHTQYSDPSLNEYVEDPAFDGDFATVRTKAPAVDPESGDAARIDPGQAQIHYPDFDPADVDRSDFDPDPSQPPEAPGPTIPPPRQAEHPTMRIAGSGAAVPAGDDATDGDADRSRAHDAASIGGMLIVSDLDRSLRFYSEMLGFTIVYAVSGNAVLEYGGARILLQHMADFSGIDRKVGHLHIQVPDLEAAYNELMAKGVAFRYRPKIVSRSDDMELWKAAFDDPDGHGVALAEWRHRR